MEWKLQKQRAAGTKKIVKLQGSIAKAEEEMAALDGEMLEAGVDLSKIHELTARKEELQATLDARYAEWEELEALLGGTELAAA